MEKAEVEGVKLGDRVKLLSPGGLTGRVVEFRGPLGPNGAQVYRICYRRKPPGFTEVLREQMEILPPKS